MNPSKTLIGFFCGLCGLVVLCATVAYSLHGYQAFADPNTRTDRAHSSELSRETALNQLILHDPREAERLIGTPFEYWCIRGFVYVTVGHGIAPIMHEFESGNVPTVLKCEDFK